jgi:hypothetical protein
MKELQKVRVKPLNETKILLRPRVIKKPIKKERRKNVLTTILESRAGGT